MKSSCATICYPSYKIRCFLSVFFLAFCALSLSAYSVGDGSAPDTTTPPPDTPTDTTAPSPDNLTDTTAPPQSTPTGLLPNSTSPEAMTNPCNSLSHEPIAFKACNDFLSDPLANGGDKDFSHAVYVKNTQELLAAVEDYPDDSNYRGSIIVLHHRAGSMGMDYYTLPRRLNIDHKVALVGAREGGTYPNIKADKDILKTSHPRTSLVDLRRRSSKSSSGFYSFQITWYADIADLEDESKETTVYPHSAISSVSYPGNIRIYKSHFTSQLDSNNIDNFLILEDSDGEIYVGHNSFDSYHVDSALISARCANCSKDTTKIEIVSNLFVGQSNPSRKTTPLSVFLRGYKRFLIENNQQDSRDPEAASQISVYLKNNARGVSGVIRDNSVISIASQAQRTITIEAYMVGSEPLSFTGSLTVTGNTNYIISYSRNLRRFLGSTSGAGTIAQSSSTTQPPLLPSRVVQTSAAIMPTQTQQAIASRSTTPSPTPAIPSTTPMPTVEPRAICDHMYSVTEITASEIDACKAFLNNEKASGGRSFSMAVVVSNARELDEAVTGKFPEGNPDASRLVVLKSGTYPLTRFLDITRKVALVGVLKDGEYPTIKTTKDWGYRLLAYLRQDPEVAETGFFSHHIHWDISSTPIYSFFYGLIKKRAIYSNSYQGDIRIYENKFSEARLSYINSYIELVDAIGGTFIEDNRFDTAYLTECTIIANCQSKVCQAAEPPLDVSNNHFYIETSPSPDALEFLKSYRKEPPKSMCVLGYMRFRIAGNQQKTKDATGSILLRDHYDVKRLHGYVLNNIAHKDAPELQRKIIFQSSHFADHYLRVTGKLHVLGNDYYTFDESGLAPSFIDYIPGKQVIAPSQTISASSTVKAASSVSVSPDAITPTGSLIAATASVRPLPAKTEPCNDIRDHPTAFEICKAFLQDELASGPTANKPAFSHAIVVSTTLELIDAINKTTGDDGRPVSGRIILLEPDTYELSKALSANHRVAMVALKSEDGRLPVITAARDFSGSEGPDRSLLYLKAVSDPLDTGFYSWNLEWRTSRPDTWELDSKFQSHIFAEGYNGDIRIYQNRFSDRHDRMAWPWHAVLLDDNTGYGYYIGHNVFYTTVLSSMIESTARLNSLAAIEVDANEFRNSYGFDERPDAIKLADYQQLKIHNNIQKYSSAAVAIKVRYENNQRIRSAVIRNNRAHADASQEERIIQLQVHKKSFDEKPNLSGYVKVTGNDYYKLKILDFDEKNYRYTPLEEATARSARSKSTVTPSLPAATVAMNGYGTSEPSLGGKIRSAPSSIVPTRIQTTVVSSVTSGSAPSSLPPPSSPCDQLTDSDKAQLCQQLLNELEEMNIRTTFSEVVIVKNTWELLHEVDMTSESGKVILLQAGSYELYEQLRVVRPVALVGIGNTVIKQAVDYPAEAESLVLLDYASTGLGFFSKGITWDISASDSIRSNPISTAIKAVHYRGKLVMSGDEFQYNAIRENEKAPSHYIEVRDSSGDVIITGSTFFSGGLTKAAIYADCKNCLEEVQKMDISGNRFTDSNSGESAPAAIDVRHYRILKVRKNVQETESVSVNISVVLPNNNDDIYAFVADNIVMGSAIDEKKTIDVTVARLAKEPARIDGLVQVYSNRCFSVNLDEIPSDILEFAEGNCSALPNIQALRGSPTPSHNGLSTGQWVGIGFAVGAAAVFGGCGLYGLTNLPGHGRAWSFFILPKTLALAATAKVLAWCNQRKWGSLSEDDDTVSFSPSAGVEMKTGLTKDPEMNLGESEGDQFPLIENPIMEPEL